jgi:polyphosphate kinase
MNSLVDPVVIEELYRASQAGVRIDLIVRGICCLRPGVAGMSENVRVVSILGRFLEHSRTFRFETGVATTTYLGSADMMQRNLDSRIEVITPVRDPALSERLHAILELELADTGSSWELAADGSWMRRAAPHGDDRVVAQEELMRQAAVAAGRDAGARLTRREETAERLRPFDRSERR